jgi:hypothetical protein
MFYTDPVFDILGPQKVIDLIRPKIVDELLTPFGLRPEPVPVVVADLRHTLMGITDWNGDQQRPYRIRIDRPRFGSEIRSPLDMAGVLAHELVHASLWRNIEENNRYSGHGPTFERYIRAIGLTEGEAWAAYKGPQFAHWYGASVAPMLEVAIEEAENARSRYTKAFAAHERGRRPPAPTWLEAHASAAPRRVKVGGG